MKETNIQQLVRLKCSELGAVVWRNNVGAYKDHTGRMVFFGLCKGSSDLIGMYKGVFLAIEVKTPTGKLRKEQRLFLDLVRNAGGLAGVARCEDDVKKIIDNELTY